MPAFKSEAAHKPPKASQKGEAPWPALLNVGGEFTVYWTPLTEAKFRENLGKGMPLVNEDGTPLKDSCDTYFMIQFGATPDGPLRMLCINPDTGKVSIKGLEEALREDLAFAHAAQLRLEAARVAAEQAEA